MTTGYLIDWSKTPEITITKKLCPLCKEPTGPDSKCYELMNNNSEFVEKEDGSISLHVRTIEIEGCQEAVLSEQCYYRRFSSWFFNCNFPISQAMALRLSSIEGIEKFIVSTAYRGEIIVAEHFDVEHVLTLFRHTYESFCKDRLEESMLLFKVQTQIQEANQNAIKEFNNELNTEARQRDEEEYIDSEFDDETPFDPTEVPHS